MVFSDEDKILIKRLYLRRYTASKEVLTDEFPEKSWTKRGVNKSQIPLCYLVADKFGAGRGPVADLLARASSLLAS